MIEINLSAARDTKPHEYLIRFLFGGAATVAAGLIARRFGAGIGGLFLAFPAIFPAGVTLLEKHEKQRKGEIGCDGTRRGRMAASIDSTGAALGCMGLWSFALVLWLLLPRASGWIALPAATLVWVVVAAGFWNIRRLRRKLGRGRVRLAARNAHASSPH